MLTYHPLALLEFSREQFHRNCFIHITHRIVFLKITYFNSLRPNDTIWWQISGSTLAQVMACCLTAPSHYLNQCWLIISCIHLRTISQEIPQPSTTRISLKIIYLKFNLNLPGANELQHCHISQGQVSFKSYIKTHYDGCLPWLWIH